MRTTPCLLPAIFLAALLASACVNTDPQTGETIPRGNQKYFFSEVEKQAEQLKDGMSKMDALILLGSPAEQSDDGDIWIYLPERPAILIPSRALRLQFENGVLVKHGYRPIILGAEL
jgi:outer membrane protein assembly factor BamE (lipoprotein component of BamABCDE complex)